MRVPRRRRLVLKFSREEPHPEESISGDGVVREEPEEEPPDLVFVLQTRAMAEGFRSLDEVVLEEVFEVKALVIKTTPKFLRGAFMGAMIFHRLMTWCAT